MSALTESPMLLAVRVPYPEGLEELLQFVPQVLGCNAADTNSPTTVHWLADNRARTSVAQFPTAALAAFGLSLVLLDTFSEIGIGAEKV